MIIFSFRSASCWSLCQVGHQADTRWQQHTPVWLPPSCMKAELQYHIGVCREKVKVSPRSYLRAKMEKKSVKARPEGSENGPTLSPVIAGTVFAEHSHILDHPPNKKKTKWRFGIQSKKGRKEKRRRKKWQEQLPSLPLTFGVETPRSDKAGRHVWLSSRLCLPARPNKNHSEFCSKKHGRNLRSLS